MSELRVTVGWAEQGLELCVGATLRVRAAGFEWEDGPMKNVEFNMLYKNCMQNYLRVVLWLGAGRAPVGSSSFSDADTTTARFFDFRGLLGTRALLGPVGVSETGAEAWDETKRLFSFVRRRAKTQTGKLTKFAFAR